MAEAVSKTHQLAAMFKALGDPARLRIFEFLCASSNTALALQETGEVRPVHGLTVGEVCCSINGDEKVTSTISQQLKQLRHAGLITMERRGKNMICSVDHHTLALIASYVSECERSDTKNACCE